jgi:hypothetical protein
LEVQDVRVDSSSPGRVRLAATVRYDSDQSPAETYWFDVPERFADDLASSGNPWLACLAPLAATLQEPLRIGLPVDRLLARNVRELLCIWSFWYPSLKAVSLELEVSDPAEERGPRRTGAFFSGGVDSFYTVLRHRKGTDGALCVDELILVRGFDFPLEHARAFEGHRQRMSAAAEGLGVELVRVGALQCRPRSGAPIPIPAAGGVGNLRRARAPRLPPDDRRASFDLVDPGPA